MKKHFHLSKPLITATVVVTALVLFICFYNPIYAALQKAGIFKAAPNGTFVEVLDVGEADAILLCSKGKVMLVDTADSSEPIVNKLNIRGITEIDSLVLTHAHSDHIGGLHSILNNFKVNNLYYTENNCEDEELKLYFDSIIETAANNGTKIKQIESGFKFSVGDISVFVPFANGETNNVDTKENDASAVLCANVCGKRFLLMADAGYSTENFLLNNYKNSIMCDVLKVGHHGANTATSENFLKCAKPKYAAISCGADNIYGHPEKEVLNRLADNNVETLRTDIWGDIKFVVKDKNIYVK